VNSASKKNKIQQKSGGDGTRIYGLSESKEKNKFRKSSNEIRCKNCGVVNQSDSNYCRNCGKPLLDLYSNQKIEVDLTEIEGEGSFPCPKCGTVISPNDETEKVYKIVDAKIINNELTELFIICSKCKSKIKLIGFS